MRNIFAFLLILAGQSGISQVFAPVATTGFNMDAVAENTTAAATTAGPLDASSYVMYSAAYGALYNLTTGLPNNGVLSSGTRTYQLEPYNQNNVLFVMPSLRDSLTLTTPAQFAGISLLGFETEGSSTFDVILRFTDNSTVAITNQTLPDWFNNTASPFIAGFDRVSRTTGTPAQTSGNPKMFTLDLVLDCASRAKNLMRIIISNTGTNPRVVLMAVSGAAAPVFTTMETPVTCQGGTNGSGSVSVTGGVAPYSYTVLTSPPQFNAQAIGLTVGTYSYLAQDAGSCVASGTFAVTQSLTTQPALTITASQYSVCAFNNVTLTSSPASSYTWSTGSHNNTVSVTGAMNFTVGVTGKSFINCDVSGTITVFVNPLPVVSVNTVSPQLCITDAPVLLTGNPAGGVFSGTGVGSGSFSPAVAGVGSHAILYNYVDANGCTGDASLAVSVSSLAAPAFTMPASVCQNAATLQLSGIPSGGVFSGPGIASGVFDPSVAGHGNATVHYSITSGVCTSTASAAIIVHSTTPVTFTLSRTGFCTNSALMALNANPGTGTYSGPGVSGSFFSAAQAGPGTHSVTFTHTNIAGCKTVAGSTVTVSECTGIAEQGTLSLRVFPNPAAGGEFLLSSDVEAQISVFSLQGMFLQRARIQEGETVRFSGFAPGVYQVVLSSGAAVQTVRVIVID